MLFCDIEICSSNVDPVYFDKDPILILEEKTYTTYNRPFDPRLKNSGLGSRQIF